MKENMFWLCLSVVILYSDYILYCLGNYVYRDIYYRNEDIIVS